MAKTQEELNTLKEEVETMNKKLAELTEEELVQVTGGNIQQEIVNLAKQHFQLEEEGLGDDAEAYLEKMGRFYEGIIPSK